MSKTDYTKYYFTSRKGKSFHKIDKHAGITQYDVYKTISEVIKKGFKPCKVCIKV